MSLEEGILRGVHVQPFNIQICAFGNSQFYRELLKQNMCVSNWILIELLQRITTIDGCSVNYEKTAIEVIRLEGSRIDGKWVTFMAWHMRLSG